jgi:beta-mannanase
MPNKLFSFSMTRSVLFITSLLLALFVTFITVKFSKTLAAQNLIPNASLETAGTNGDPDKWFRGGWGVNDRRFSYPVAGFDGSKAARVEMTTRTSGDVKWYFGDLSVTPGESYTFSHHYRANVATELLAQFVLADGSIKFQYLGAITPSASWTPLQRTIVAPANAKTLTIFHLLYSPGYLEVDTFNLGAVSAAADNIVTNPSLETIGRDGNPDTWLRGGWGTNDRRYTFPVAGVDGTNAARVEMTTRTSGDAKWYFEYVPVVAGKSYTFAHSYRSNATTELLAHFKTSTGEQFQYLGSVPASSGWSSIVREIIPPAGVKSMTIFHLIYSPGYLEVDKYSVNEFYTNVSPSPTSATPSPSLVGSAPTPPPASPTPTPTPPPSPTFSNKEWGVFVGWQPEAMGQFVSLVGKTPKYRAVFTHWGNENKFPHYLANDLAARGQTLVIFWEATNYNVLSVSQPTYSYDAILSGRWDTYFTQFAADVRAYGKEVIIIPFSEANGNWFPWGGFVNGNTPAKHNEAFRYIREFFRNAPNAKFGWAPNQASVPNIPQNAIEVYYPGDAYVDYVGIDGFNFGTPWLSFNSLFEDSLAVLKTYNKPIFVFSFASAAGTQKASWITNAITTEIGKYPEVKAWIWFNENKERDWRVNSDSASLEAFKRALP